MRRFSLILLGSVFFVVGCEQPNDSYRLVENQKTEVAMNRKNLKNLEVGMSRQQVITIMGEKTAGSAIISDENREILFYRTNIKCARNDITSPEDFLKYQITPIVFENGELVGWGWEFFESNSENHKHQFPIDFQEDDDHNCIKNAEESN